MWLAEQRKWILQVKDRWDTSLYNFEKNVDWERNFGTTFVSFSMLPLLCESEFNRFLFVCLFTVVLSNALEYWIVWFRQRFSISKQYKELQHGEEVNKSESLLCGCLLKKRKKEKEKMMKLIWWRVLPQIAAHHFLYSD